MEVTILLDPDNPELALTLEAPDGATVHWLKLELCSQDPTGSAVPESFLICPGPGLAEDALDDGVILTPELAVLSVRSPLAGGGDDGTTVETVTAADSVVAADAGPDADEASSWTAATLQQPVEVDQVWEDDEEVEVLDGSGREAGVGDAEPWWARGEEERGETEDLVDSAGAGPEDAVELRAREQEMAAAEAEAASAAAQEEVRRAQDVRRAKEEASRQRIAGAGDTWHKVLGVSPAATQETVKRVFHDLALMHHPDKCLCRSEDGTFKRVQWAYEQGLKVAPLEAPRGGRPGGETTVARRRGPLDVGDQVVVDGLDKRSDLNGQWAVCQTGVDLETGRVEVIVTSGETVRIRAENLTRTDLYKGTPVRVVGLHARPELNGLVGCLGDYDAAKERWNVDMPDKSVLRLLSKCCVRTKLNAKPIVMADGGRSRWTPDMFGTKRGRCNKCGSKCPQYKCVNMRMNGCGMPGGAEKALNCLRCGCSNQDHANLGKVVYDL